MSDALLPLLNPAMLPTGSDKHQVEVSGPEYTVGQLLQRLAEITEIPTSAQKVIFKGTLIFSLVSCGKLSNGGSLVVYSVKYSLFTH